MEDHCRIFVPSHHEAAVSAAARAGRAAGEPGPRHRRHPPAEEVSPGGASGGGRGEARLVQLLPALEVTLDNKTCSRLYTRHVQGRVGAGGQTVPGDCRGGGLTIATLTADRDMY